MITNFFIPELNNHDVQELWFQQDGATCHTARATIDLLKDTFGDRLISRFGPVNWPPRSCDLTPLDYFLWGYVKSLVYADKPQTFDHLEDNIRRVIADIRPQMLEKVIENWTSRLDYIRASRGSPMPEIIFKIIRLCDPAYSVYGGGGEETCWDARDTEDRVLVDLFLAPIQVFRIRTSNRCWRRMPFSTRRSRHLGAQPTPLEFLASLPMETTQMVFRLFCREILLLVSFCCAKDDIHYKRLFLWSVKAKLKNPSPSVHPSISIGGHSQIVHFSYPHKS
ncbi:hypothetical protein TNCV_2207961 [Trichonephila clavipes]|uniref:Transposase n=1 Tax=Trichonephila clavipes TaxID=2585209 RepID=A0A8X6S656_TRICX|nr:hypothetical protein TNCV_2207961 [Trichonephila clavipes]